MEGQNAFQRNLLFQKPFRPRPLAADGVMNTRRLMALLVSSVPCDNITVTRPTEQHFLRKNRETGGRM